ncbi:MAG TPA: alpha/beta hydrolase [Coleofasciculaceae cyanobacterium]|jgi:hypothetical protein
MGLRGAVPGIQAQSRCCQAINLHDASSVPQGATPITLKSSHTVRSTAPSCFDHLAKALQDQVDRFALSMIFEPDAVITPLQPDLQKALDDRNAEIDDKVKIPASDGSEMNGWYVKAAPGRPTVLYAHGNSGNITRDFRQTNMASFVRAGYGFLMFDYRGYGQSPGQPSEKGVYADYRSALKYLKEKQNLRPERDIVAVGESLGSAVAVDAAVDTLFRALVIFPPFTTMEEMMVWRARQMHIPGFVKPSNELNRMFRTIDKIAKVRSPILIAHGVQDEQIPLEMSHRNHAAATGSLWKADLYEVPAGNHNDLFVLRGPELVAEIDRLLVESEPLFLMPSPGRKTGFLSALREKMMWA